MVERYVSRRRTAGIDKQKKKTLRKRRREGKMARVIETNLTEEDRRIEGSLRPQYLKDYIGQEKAKSTLKIYIEAAKQRQDALDQDRKSVV